MKQKRRRYHVVVLREDGRAVHNRVLEWFQVKRHLTWIGGVAGFLLLGTLASFFLASWQGILLRKNIELASREHRLQEAFVRLSREVDEAKDRLARTEHEIERMREMAREQNLPVPTPQALGGPAPSASAPPAAGDLRGMAAEVKGLSSASQQVLEETERLASTLEPHLRSLARTPSVWPAKGFIISPFGARQDPFDGEPAFHEGVDIAAPFGSPVCATAEGLVVFTGYRRGYGTVVEINHGGGLTTRYAHLSRVFVQPGQNVKRWQKIGAVGSSGRSTGPHVHYEVRKDNRALNPKRFLQY